RETRLAHRHHFLEKPLVTQHVGAVILFDFKTDDVPRNRCRNIHYLGVVIGVQLSAFHVEISRVRHILVFNLKIFSHRRNAPSPNTRYLCLGIIEEMELAKATSIWTQNLKRASRGLFYFAV